MAPCKFADIRREFIHLVLKLGVVVIGSIRGQILKKLDAFQELVTMRPRMPYGFLDRDVFRTIRLVGGPSTNSYYSTCHYESRSSNSGAAYLAQHLVNFLCSGSETPGADIASVTLGRNLEQLPNMKSLQIGNVVVV